MHSPSSEKLLLGRISGIFGVYGWVKIFSHTEPRDNILNYSPWYVSIDGQWQTFEVTDGQAQQGGKTVVAKLKGIDDREMARTFIGCDIAIDKAQLPQLKDDYYWSDLIGCQVINEDSQTLGEVVNLLETGGHDVLRIEGGEESLLIPFVMHEYILDVDLAEKRIHVRWELDNE